MNSRAQQMADALAALSADERNRLDRLAERAGMRAEEIWSDVWQYGFDDTEESVQANIEADADIAAGRTIPNEQVMADMWRMVNSGLQKKKTG
ncbi:hypothetical protein H3H37_18610 [Duganella sp. LX20W]|uniref:Uncharacterized protein n=1 Tax=Rugamonas brunnea TaxID=2758569 RepID=A0A7W2IDA9_9BURK|nr:hypothetical protein [Rugamonas brunnea]MBA5639075.1 hypothetical protein [Rugamonas brunnea]